MSRCLLGCFGRQLQAEEPATRWDRVQITKKKAVLMLQMTSSLANKRFSWVWQLAPAVGPLSTFGHQKHGQPQLEQLMLLQSRQDYTRRGATHHMLGDRECVQAAKKTAPMMHMASSSANMKRMRMSISRSTRERLLGGSVAFIITCTHHNQQVAVLGCQLAMLYCESSESTHKLRIPAGSRQLCSQHHHTR